MRTLTGGYNDPINYVDLLGLEAEVAKQIVSNPQNLETAFRVGATGYILAKSAAAGGSVPAASGGGAAVVAGRARGRKNILQRVKYERL